MPYALCPVHVGYLIFMRLGYMFLPIVSDRQVKDYLNLYCFLIISIDRILDVKFKILD